MQPSLHPDTKPSDDGALEISLSDYLLEPLHTDGGFILYRGRRDSTTPAILVLVPVLEHPGPATLAYIRQAYSLKAELNSEWAVRPLGLTQLQGRTVLVLDDPGGEPLARFVGAPMELGRYLRWAISLSGALAHFHSRFLIHNDIKPANVMVNSRTDQAWLMGFGVASRLIGERLAAEPPALIAGSLAYIAPEQTGRMNRSVDYRSDFYSLGVTLYQMLTGILPFEGDDALEIVYSHIARTPVPPHELNRDVPEMVSRIVMKLMAKIVEDRYQTAGGVKADLERCAAEQRDHGRIAPFPLGARDIPDRLLISGKLYGRKREVDALLAAFDRVIEGGRVDLVLVSGYSGIGKSSVVNELRKALVPPRGLFASGKFDQYKRGIPYSTLAQAFEALIRSLLSKSAAELDSWRHAFEEALEPNGRLIADLVPEIKLIIGEQPAVPALEPSQAKARFQLVFRRFIGVFARQQHPLALFVDDLQWIDGATLDLIEDLLTQEEVRHLLLIGAYRDNEAGPDHPLIRKLGAIRKAGAAVHEITLAPLALADVTQLIADSLHCDPEGAAPLARLIHQKTAGNPFFTIQFLSALAQEGLVAFDYDQGRWSWDVTRIHAKGYSDNVADLMDGELIGLPDTTQKVLQQLACLGNVAQTQTLCLVLKMPEEGVHAVLQEAVRREFVQRLGDSYRFVHDRVQEAAYALIPEAARAEAHHRIGRLLLTHTPEEKREDAIFEIVNQLNRGTALIDSNAEREELAGLNLIAGKRAKASMAYLSALAYLTTGTMLVAEDCWERRHDLAYSLEISRAECEFLTGDHEGAEQRLAIILEHAADTIEQAAVACLRIDLYTALDQSKRAIAAGLDFLRRVGIDCPPHPSEEEVRCEYERVKATLGSHAIEEPLGLPLMSNPAALATVEVLTKLWPPAVFTDANLASLILCKAVSLSLEWGNCDASCFAYALLGRIAGRDFGNYQDGFRFGQLGYQLVERCGLKRFEARTYLCFANSILPWIKHVQAGRDLQRRAFESANWAGDLLYGAFACNSLNTDLLFAGEPLPQVQNEAENGLAFAEKTRFGLVIDSITAQLALIRTLRGLTLKFGSFDDERFKEVHAESHFSSSPALAIAACRYWIRKLQARYIAGDYATAIDAASHAQRLLWTAPLAFEEAEYHFYGALARAAYCDCVSDAQRRQHFDALIVHHKQLEIWAENCPANFETRAALISAEIARIDNRVLDAERLYELAIQSAHANGFVHNEAIAYELAATFYRQRGFDRIAQAYLTQAAACYTRWGALGKVKQLERLHPRLAQAGERQPAALAEHLDALSLVKVHQAISSEIETNKLLGRVMHIVMENAGAESAFLLLERDGQWRIAAKGGIDAAEVKMPQPVGIEESGLVSSGVVRFVARTKQAVVLDDASGGGDFVNDAHVRNKRTKSLLCLPLVSRGRLMGILYSENNLATQVFNPGRVRLLEMLLSQAAISLENARMYETVRESEERHRVTLQTAMDGFFRTDLKGRFIEVNETYCRMSGYSELELLTMNAADITVVRSAEMIADEIRIVAEEGSRRLESVYRRKDGSLFDVEISAQYQPIAGGQVFAFVRDITERKRAEKSLRQSEAYLAEAQQLSHTGSFAFDLADNKYIYLSEECSRIFEWDAQESFPSREAISRLIHPEDWDRVKGDFEKLLREKVDTSSEFRVALPSGTVKHIQAIRHPVLNDVGDVVTVVGTAIDITDRKRVEETLRLAGVYNRSLIEASLDPLVAIDPEGRIRDVNAATELVTGYTREQLIGTEFLNYFTEPGTARAGYEQAFNQGFVRDYELEIRNRNGEITPVLYNASVYRDGTGNVIGVFAAARDITELKQAHEARTKLAAIVESSDDAIISKDLDGTITSWNEGAERLYGYPASEALGKPVSILMPPDQQNQVAMLLGRIMEGIGIDHYETKRIRKDGGTIDVSLTLSPVRDHRGQIIAVSTIARDITERKQAQEALEELLADLELRVKERTKELSEANQSLEAANKELESFSYSVSHDLLAPLRRIEGFSQILLEDYGPQLDEEAVSLLGSVRSNTAKMGQLIEDLLALSRLGRTAMQVRPIDMSNLAYQVSEELKSMNPDRTLRITINDMPSALADEILLRQVLTNLIENAIKFTREKDIGVIDVVGYESGNEKIYSIKDNGAGFDMAYYHKLFEVFQRLHSSDEFEGTGVGLAIVHRIVSRHGGRVWAEGEIGKGAIFYFSLADMANG
ncbi:MAG TPA: PAS domain S-box protein [Desulfomonilaceae bacterium]|nr:PAS domain S-box protein [Desulfomonilaceae bacterium]